MKQLSPTDFKRLEQKVDLLHDKLDRLMAAQGLVRSIDPERVQEKDKQKVRERNQERLPDKEAFQQQVLQGMKDSAMRMGLGKERVYPGDIVKAEITMLSPMIFKGRLLEGMAFQFREGPRGIGTGTAIEILHDELKSLAKEK